MRNRRRGIALFIVLMVMFVLLTLLGAFVRVNSTNLNLLGQGLTRVQAEEACNSALQYAWMRLDKEPNWGAVDYFTSHPANETWGTRLDCHGVGNAVTGKIHNTEMTFTVRIFNNLNNASADVANRVPKYAVRLSIDGQANAARKHMDVILRKRAFVDSSAVSAEDMAVTGDSLNWNIDSTDRQVNMVRSGGDLHGPKAGVGGGPTQIHFLKPAGTPAAAQGPFGTAWASNNIKMGAVDLSLGTAAEIAGANAKGQFLANTNGKYTVPELEPDDLVGPTTEKIVPGGTYSFEIAGTPVAAVAPQPFVADIPAVEAVPAVGIPGDPDYVPPVEAQPAIPGHAAVAGTTAYTQYQQKLIYTPPSGSPQVLASVDSGVWEGLDYHPVPLTTDYWVPLALDGSNHRTDKSVLANLKTCQIVVAPGVKAVVPSGDFIVQGQLGSGNLALGTKVAGADQEEHDDHHGHRRHGNYDDDNPKPADLAQPSSLEAVDGSVSIYGAATGWGAIVSKEKNISLRMRNALATDPDGGVAIFAGGNVTMNRGQQSYGVDCPDATFLGLVYAKGDFLVNADGQNLTIEGALVSKKTIKVLNATNVNFKYNPDFLFDIIDKSIANSPTRLEQISLTIR